MQHLRLRSLLFLAMASLAPLGAVEIVAHRGASHDAPENTMRSTMLAWTQGADAVENDIYLSRDGKIIVFHDKASAVRTTGRDVPIHTLTLDEARELDAGSRMGPQFQGERIPLFDDQLTSIPAGKRMLVEIKVGPELVAELKRALNENGATEKVTVISFNYDALLEVRRQLPQVPTLWLVSYPEPGAKKTSKTKSPPSVDEMIRKVRAAGLTGLDLKHTWPLTDEDAGRIKAAGVELHVWTVNDPEVAKRWIGLGVTSITTDRPGWLREQLKL